MNNNKPYPNPVLVSTASNNLGDGRAIWTTTVEELTDHHEANIPTIDFQIRTLERGIEYLKKEKGQ